MRVHRSLGSDKPAQFILCSWLIGGCPAALMLVLTVNDRYRNTNATPEAKTVPSEPNKAQSNEHGARATVAVSTSSVLPMALLRFPLKSHLLPRVFNANSRLHQSNSNTPPSPGRRDARDYRVYLYLIYTLLSNKRASKQ